MKKLGSGDTDLPGITWILRVRAQCLSSDFQSLSSTPWFLLLLFHVAVSISLCVNVNWLLSAKYWARSLQIWPTAEGMTWSGWVSKITRYIYSLCGGDVGSSDQFVAVGLEAPFGTQGIWLEHWLRCQLPTERKDQQGSTFLLSVPGNTGVKLFFLSFVVWMAARVCP